MDQITTARLLAERAAKWRESYSQSYAVTRGAERVPEVNELRRELVTLGVKEVDYFAEGLDCIQYAQASRAAIVLGWTGYIDLLQDRIGRDSFAALNAMLKMEFHGVHKKAGQVTSKKMLAEFFDDALLLTAGRKLGIYEKHAYTQLDAMRDERNNCAHVQEYAVTPRIALGFYAKLIKFLPCVL
jgi:hypothetical protein